MRAINEVAVDAENTTHPPARSDPADRPPDDMGSSGAMRSAPLARSQASSLLARLNERYRPQTVRSKMTGARGAALG
jgi:hypothetical protein